MNRKLILLNVVLIGLVVFAGVQLHKQRQAAQAREAAVERQKVPVAPPPNLPPIPAPGTAVPATYQDVAVHDLFDPSRKPDVDVAPPPPPPPPPVPPALPMYHGSMNMGDGPIAYMSAGGPQQSVRPGGKIGDFKLVDFNRQEITLEWQGQVIHKRLDDLKKREGGGDSAAAGSAPVNKSGTVMPGVAGPPLPAPVTSDLGPGRQYTESTKSCQPGDSNPAGTVQDGYRKVVRPGPFGGGTCLWEAVGK